MSLTSSPEPSNAPASAVVTVDGRRRHPASGIVWSADGLIATANHVVERDEEIEIGLPDGRSIAADLVGRDPGSDLALLRIAASDVAPLPRSDVEPRVGQIALAIARPGPSGVMASLGVISAVAGPLRFRGGGALDRYVQADVAMLPGFSGGPLVDSVGNLIGLNSSTLGRAGQLTVLAATIDATVATLLQHGRVRRGYLGVGAQGVRLPETLARALDNGQELGLLIVSVEAGGPADTAGLMLGDVILAVDGTVVGQVEQLQEQLSGIALVRASRSASPAVENRVRSQSPSASASAKPNRAESIDMSITLEREQTVETPVAPALAGLALSEAIADIVAEITPSVVLVGQGGSHGAGVIWRSDGIVITNRHVIRDDRVDVVLDDGRKFTGIVAARHPDRDLAVVKIAADGLPAARLGDSSTVRPGQIAIAVGHPPGTRSAATAGIVVAAGQAATLEGPRTGDWLQTDVTLRPGNSGGPLVDARGGVIGINTMVSGRLALSIPSSAVERFVAGERPGDPRAWLGIHGLAVPLRRPEHDAGFLLTEVAEGSPADRAD